MEKRNISNLLCKEGIVIAPSQIISGRRSVKKFLEERKNVFSDSIRRYFIIYEPFKYCTVKEINRYGDNSTTTLWIINFNQGYFTVLSFKENTRVSNKECKEIAYKILNSIKEYKREILILNLKELL